MPNRTEALDLLHEWVENAGLRKHMYSVEAAMRHYARKQGEDEEAWGIAGLLHDLDWERHPDEHPHKGVDELRTRGYSDDVIQAILAHGYPERTDVEPTTAMERTLFACDELCGLIYACCLVRPNGIDDLQPRSVVKKLKDKAFAAGVQREDVARGLELIGLERSEHIQNVIDGMREIAEVLEVRSEDRAAPA